MRYSFRNPAGKQASDELPPQDRRESTAEALANLPKSRWERSWPVIACGAGLFSDGYLNGYARTFALLSAHVLKAASTASSDR